MDLLQEAYEIAANADVSSAPNTVVLYSISYQKSRKNKDLALEYIKNNPQSLTLDDTDCGKKLILLGAHTNFRAPESQLMQIWAIASERFIMAASGNVTAFVENADLRSTFMSIELPNILKNNKIRTINNTDKFVFAKNMHPKIVNP